MAAQPPRVYASGDSSFATSKLALAAFVAMELAWVSLGIGLAWIGWAGGSWPLPAVLLAPGIAGVVAAKVTPPTWGRHRWFDLYRWGLGLAVAGAGGQLAAVTLGANYSTSALLLAIAIGLILYWRGWFVGEDEPDARGVETAFQVGALAVLPLLGLLQWAASGAGQGAAVTFFLSGLLAIGLARRAERRTQRSGPEPDWLVMAGMLAVITLLLAGVLLMVVSPDLLEVIGSQFLWVLRLLGGLIGGLVFLAVPAPPPPSESLRIAPVPSPGALGTPLGLELHPAVFWVLERLADALLVTIFAYGIYRLILFGLRRARNRVPDTSRGEAPRSEPIPFSWKKWWREILNRLFGWLRPRKGGAAVTASERGASSITREQHTVRELYRSFLSTAARSGLPRTQSQTPNEFAYHLGARRPAVVSYVGELTYVYERARYALERIDGRELGRMRTAVTRASDALRQHEDRLEG